MIFGNCLAIGWAASRQTKRERMALILFQNQIKKLYFLCF
jgi:hypothetical protein